VISGALIAGVDGCRGGWVVVTELAGAIGAFITNSFGELLDTLPSNSLIAIDTPIGLPERSARLCDAAARKFLKAPRASSVFPAPIRPALGAQSYEAASGIRREIEGKGISKQAFAIYSKICEVDETLRLRSDCRIRVREVHPEVSFAYWNNGCAMALSKKSAAGAGERERLIDGLWPGVRTELRKMLPRDRVKRDDLNDAFAALWTARRIAAGRAVVLPNNPARDAFGLPMEIVA
jgi:predicted RNase H-like nuclease